MCIINAANCVLKHQNTVTRKRHDFVYKSERRLNVSVKLNLFSSVLLEHLCVAFSISCLVKQYPKHWWTFIMYSRDILSEVEKISGLKSQTKVFISFHICISIYIIVGNFTPVIVNVVNTCLQSQRLPHLSMKYKKISNKLFCNNSYRLYEGIIQTLISLPSACACFQR